MSLEHESFTSTRHGFKTLRCGSEVFWGLQKSGLVWKWRIEVMNVWQWGVLVITLKTAYFASKFLESALEIFIFLIKMNFCKDLKISYIESKISISFSYVETYIMTIEFNLTKKDFIRF